MTKKQRANLFFGIFSLGSGLACFFWATNLHAGWGFVIGGGWVALLSTIQYLIEKRVGV